MNTEDMAILDEFFDTVSYDEEPDWRKDPGANVDKDELPEEEGEG